VLNFSPFLCARIDAAEPWLTVRRVLLATAVKRDQRGKR
jgi:hypothetical protein